MQREHCQALMCGQVEHQTEQASYFCKQQECQEHNPICVLCAFSSHKQHSVEPFKLIIDRIHQDARSLAENLTLFAEVDVLKDRLYELTATIGDGDLRELMKLTIGHFLEDYMGKIDIDEVTKLSDAVRDLYSSRKSNQAQIIKKISQYYKKFENLKEETKDSSNYSRFLSQKVDNLKQICAAFEQQIKKNSIDAATVQIFMTATPKKFQFSLKHKNPGLTLVGDNKLKINDEYVSNNYLALCVPSLSLKKVQSITFDMVSLLSYVTVGVCKKKTIGENYLFNSGQSNHGTFQMSFDGYAWCDGNSTYNQQYTSWYYNQGDKVTVQFNPSTKKIKFYKNSDENQQYELPIEFDSNEKLYFCVSLNTKPEEVHIID